MRKNIDNLVLINFALILVGIVEIWLHIRYVAMVGAILACIAFAHELILFSKVRRRVEKDARPRLRKRIVYSTLQSLAILGLFASLIMNK